MTPIDGAEARTRPTRPSSRRSQPAAGRGGRAGPRPGRRSAGRAPCRRRTWSGSAAPAWRWRTGRPPTCGNAGTYMSVASGAIAVRNTTVATTAAQPAPGRRRAGHGPRLPERSVRVIAEVLAVGAVLRWSRVGRASVTAATSPGESPARCRTVSLAVSRQPRPRDEGVSVVTCTDRASHPSRSVVVAWWSWTTEPRSASSSSPDGPRSPRATPACPTSAPAGCPGCAAARSPAWPGSASSTTPSSNAAPSPASAPRSWTRIARALRLDDAERAHLFHLAQAADGTSAGCDPDAAAARHWTPRPTPAVGAGRHHRGPAIVRNGRMDLLATNPLGRAMHAASTTVPGGGAELRPLHLPRPDAAHGFYPDWDTAADTCVAILRTEAGRDPHDQRAARPGRRAVHPQRRVPPPLEQPRRPLHGAGTKTFHHRDVGELDLAYESMDMISEPGLTLTLYAAEPASRPRTPSPSSPPGPVPPSPRNRPPPPDRPRRGRIGVRDRPQVGQRLRASRVTAGRRTG